jgi:hypothetical protein
VMIVTQLMVFVLVLQMISWTELEFILVQFILLDGCQRLETNKYINLSCHCILTSVLTNAALMYATRACHHSRSKYYTCRIGFPSQHGDAHFINVSVNIG